ncbi:hypothetical protein LCGC14_3034690 [marine sediment metagenome]|uniref:Uncharacterized protein n=1 Tax=marine sediment metagenome TaxID=412755 RepID=A0A0F8WRY3_9ZZZZ
MDSHFVSALGAAGAIVLGWLLGWLQERSRRKREDQTRFHEYRRSFYVGFVHRTSAAARELLGQSTDNQNDVIEALEPLYSELRVIASPPLLQEAASLLDALASLTGRFDWVWSASGGQAGRGHADAAEIEEQTEQFVQAARKELGLPVTSVFRIR